jgi:ATP/maltotriose-dependent transcriptional regulator MalT
MALRQARRFDEASQQLDRASWELHEHTRVWSGAYHRATRIYWLYERARLDLAVGHPDDAIEKTGLALELLDEQGFWPALGILRTRIWAHRVKGQPPQAESCMDRMNRLLSRVPPATMTLMERIAEEARGMPKDDGEVY